MLKYIGTGEFVPGIPARDLTEEEVAEFGGKEFLLSTGLYAEPEKKALKTVYEDKSIK